MAIQTISPLYWPNFFSSIGANPAAANSQTLDASGEYDSWVFTPTRSFTVTHVGVYINTLTTNPSTLTVSIQNLTSGNPSGTPLQSGTSGNITAAGRVQVALGASQALTAGTPYAVVITWASGNFATGRISALPVGTNHGYAVTNVTGSAVKSANALAIDLYNGSNYLPIPQIYPATAGTVATFANNTTGAAGGDERGVRFRVPFTCRVCGFRLYNNSAAGDFDILITDDSGNELSSSATNHSATNIRGQNLPEERAFDNRVTLTANTWYRAWVRPSTTTNTALAYLTVDSTATAIREAMACGADWHYTFRTDGASINDTLTTRVPLLDLMIDGLDDGVSAGGGGMSYISNPGMSGGFI